MRTRHHRFASAIAAAGCLAAGVLFGRQATKALAQTESRTIIGEGEINANDVYVRSGDSLNHYTICKLRAGDRVTVVGERGEWYEILPPDGSFSLVSGDYVDTADNQKGLINGNNVRVRAGSLLNENKYTVQTLLSKGAEVSILGRNPDGFLRIKPPQGATVWINRSFVQLAADGRPSSTISETTATPLTGSDSPAKPDEPVDAPSPDAIPQPGGAAPLAAPPTIAASKPRTATSGDSDRLRARLDELDRIVKEQLAKPFAERQFDAALTGFREVAASGDEYIGQYAERRIAEIETAVEAADSFRQFKRLDEIADAKRREYRSARAAIPETVPTLPTGIEIKGELRASVLFPPESANPRYRLVDPSVAGGRTIGYVEIPADSPIKVNDFLGRYVGVRALERRVQSGGVDPVPLFIASELIPLESPLSPAPTGGN